MINLTGKTFLPCCVVLATLLTKISRGDELNELLQEARRSMDSIRQGRGAQWAQVQSLHRGAGSKYAFVREARGLVFRDEGYFYGVFVVFESKDKDPRNYYTTFEFAVSPDWAVVVDQRLGEENVTYIDGDAISESLLEYELRSHADVLRLFQHQVERFVDREFAVPRLDADGQLKVKYPIGGDVVKAASDASATKRYVEVTFKRQRTSIIVPDRMLLYARQGDQIRIHGFAKPFIHIADGELTLAGVYAEGRYEWDDPLTVNHILQQPTTCPGWLREGERPKVSISVHSVFKHNASFSQTKIPRRKVPASLFDNCKEVSTGELSILRQRQNDYLKTQFNTPIEQVAAKVLRVPPVRQRQNDVSESVVVAMLFVSACVVLVVVWIVLWVKRNPRMPEN